MCLHSRGSAGLISAVLMALRIQGGVYHGTYIYCVYWRYVSKFVVVFFSHSELNVSQTVVIVVIVNVFICKTEFSNSQTE